ncbi:MAG: hypothetical protein ABJ242_12235 [Marinomonas sp.]
MKTLAKIATATLLMGTLAACDSIGGGANYSEGDAQAGAGFRHHARDVVAGLNPQCPFSQKETVLAQYDEVNKRFAALKEKIAGRSFETDLALVEADYQYYWKVNTVPCASPDGENAAEAIAGEVARVDAQITELENIVGGI